MQKESTELEVARMTAEDIQFLNVFFVVCKRYKIDYYHATPKQRGFVDAVAAHEYAMKQARQQGLTCNGGTREENIVEVSKINAFHHTDTVKQYF